MLPYATTQLVAHRQRELEAEARMERLAAEARSYKSEAEAGQWLERALAFRHRFAVFATLRRPPQVRAGRATTGA